MKERARISLIRLLLGMAVKYVYHLSCSPLNPAYFHTQGTEPTEESIQLTRRLRTGRHLITLGD